MEEPLDVQSIDASAHTTSRRSTRNLHVEIITRGERRRSWSARFPEEAMPMRVKDREGRATATPSCWRTLASAGATWRCRQPLACGDAVPDFNGSLADRE
jgi:hypothetical protein